MKDDKFMTYAEAAASGKYHDLLIEESAYGATYADPAGYTVYGFRMNDRDSVLAGQESRCWLGRFDTLEEAKAAFPSARVAEGSSYQPHVDVRPFWCTPEYEAETGERWDEE
jgi:hypothetical protein